MRNKILFGGIVLCLLGVVWLLLGAEDPNELAQSSLQTQPVSDAGLAIESSVQIEESQKRAVERESIHEGPLRVQVINARTLEPVVGASIELRSGEVRFAQARALLGSEIVQATPDENGRLIITPMSQIRFASQFRDDLATKGGETIESATSGEGGWAKLNRSPLGTHLWAEKAGARGRTENVTSADEIALHIERPIHIHVLDANGNATELPSVKASFQVGSKVMSASNPPSPLGIGRTVSHGLWSDLRKLLEPNSTTPGIRMELMGPLGGYSVFLPLDQEPPNPVILHETPVGTIELRMPWAKGGLGSLLRVEMREQSRGTTYLGPAPPYRHERIPLGLAFTIIVIFQSKTTHKQEFDGPTRANEELLLEIPAPDDLQFLRGVVQIEVNGEVRAPTSQSSSVILAHGEETRAMIGSDGELLFSPPFRQEAGDSVQLWMGEDGKWYQSEVLLIRQDPDGAVNLGKVLMSKAEPLVSLEVRDESGALLPDAGVAVQKAEFDGEVRNWRMCSSVRIERNEELGIINIHGPSVLPLFRFRVQNLADYADGDWVECRPGAGLIRIVMRTQ